MFVINMQDWPPFSADSAASALSNVAGEIFSLRDTVLALSRRVTLARLTLVPSFAASALREL
jgi:hypothetical protein